MSISAHLQSLIAEHPPGQTLPGAFYTDPGLFAEETARFLAAHWFLAGHTAQIPAAGDYFTVDALGAALIVVRGADGAIHALHNVCRHRGARLCDSGPGHAALLRCRYHGWSYRTDGELAAWRHMPEGLDRRDYGLRRCAVTVFEGLILLSLDPQRAPDPAALLEPLRPWWARYQLAGCRVAAERTYRIDANWKLCIDNTLECYHCLPSHPEYTAINAFVRSDECVSAAAVAEFAAYRQGWEAQMHARGLRTGRSEISSVGGQPARAGTVPLAPGKSTASRDGRPLAPLLGQVAAYDESVTTGCFGFTSYAMAACDYALAVSYLPIDARTTDVVMRWLVRADAVAGRDYDLDELCFVWDVTTKQDKALVELNAAGVTTSGYVPGPYSQLESLAADFTARYLALLRGPA